MVRLQTLSSWLPKHKSFARQYACESCYGFRVTSEVTLSIEQGFRYCTYMYNVGVVQTLALERVSSLLKWRSPTWAMQTFNSRWTNGKSCNLPICQNSLHRVPMYPSFFSFNFLWCIFGQNSLCFFFLNSAVMCGWCVRCIMITTCICECHAY